MWFLYGWGYGSLVKLFFLTVQFVSLLKGGFSYNPRNMVPQTHHLAEDSLS